MPTLRSAHIGMFAIETIIADYAMDYKKKTNIKGSTAEAIPTGISIKHLLALTYLRFNLCSKRLKVRNLVLIGSF